MVRLTTFMVAVTAFMLGVKALDADTAKQIKSELIKAKIIPDAIDEFEPLTDLKITFDERHDLKYGERLKPEETLVVPSVWFEPTSEDSEYTLAMVNLDSNGPLIRHWIATNVKNQDNKRGTAFLSQAPKHQYTSYRGPTPPSGSSPHRVAFVLFEQKNKGHTFTPEVEATGLSNRAFFDLKKFAQENQLKPIGASWFYTEFQEGFSQTYPPVENELGDKNVKQKSLVGGVLNDLGEILEGVGGLLDSQDTFDDKMKFAMNEESNKQDLVDDLADLVNEYVSEALKDEIFDNNDIKSIGPDDIVINMKHNGEKISQEAAAQIIQQDGLLDININVGNNNNAPKAEPTKTEPPKVEPPKVEPPKVTPTHKGFPHRYPPHHDGKQHENSNEEGTRISIIVNDNLPVHSISF